LIPYFVLLGIWLLGAIQFGGKIGPDRKQSAPEQVYYVVALIFTVGFVGLRHEVGGDWIAYERMYEGIYFLDFIDAMQFTDLAFAFLNWLSAKMDAGVYLPNLVCGAVFVLGVSKLARAQASPWLAMTVAVPYLITVVGMGYTRQAAAIGVLCSVLATIKRQKTWKTVAMVGVAALFHKTSLLFLPVFLAPTVKRNWFVGLLGAVVFSLLALVALRGSTDAYINSYVNSEYQSSGAAVRVGMNIVAACIFLALRKKFVLSDSEKLIWTIFSGLAVACGAALLVISSSVGVDRLALFLIPLQVVVYSNLPFLFSKGTRASLIIAVIGYCILVQYIYFFHASYSYAWVPYQNYLFIGTPY
jgi:hypothetical protein